MKVNFCQEMELNVIHWRLMVTEVGMKSQVHLCDYFLAVQQMLNPLQ